MTLRTKYDVLRERLSTLETAAADLRRYVEGLETTEFGKPCSACGEILETEAEFARHFLVPDERYLNLGECPKRVRR